jgi:tetratricopeptide (TPR) repeat protein
MTIRFATLSAIVVAIVAVVGIKDPAQVRERLHTLLADASHRDNPPGRTARLPGTGAAASDHPSAIAPENQYTSSIGEGGTGSQGGGPVVVPSPATEVAQANPADIGASSADAVPPKPEDVAQATPNAAAQGAPASAGQQQPAVDESALRYFASRGDKARLDAEISRLRALYPTWVPPSDPLAVPPNEDKALEAMWQLYSEARYAQLRKAIADRQASEPGWQPPADLLERLSVAEARVRLVNASDLKQYDAVIDIGAGTPSLLTCSEVDVLWRVADAFAHTNRFPRARDAYLYILKNCENPAERLATVQKASTLLPYGTMQDLLSQEKPSADGAGREFDSIRDDLARRFVGEANDDPKLVIAPSYVSEVEQAFNGKGMASDALLLGWYNLRRENMTDAEKWFRASRAKEDTASASQGLALTLLARKAPQEAEDIMYKWRDGSKDATATYLATTANLLALDPPASLQADVLQRIAAEVLKDKDVPTAQQFGWYARTLNQMPTAAQWFETALRWKVDDEPSAYGLAVTRLQLNDRRGLGVIQQLWAGRSARIAAVGVVEQPDRTGRPAQPVQAGAALATTVQPGQPLQSGQPIQTVRPQPVVAAEAPVMRPASRQAAPRRGRVRTVGCVATVDPQTLRPAEALTRGWCLMDINRPVEAAAAFDVGQRTDSLPAREDAAYGQALAYMRLGLANKAAVSAAAMPQNSTRTLELQRAILTARATNAFDAKRYRESILYLDQLAQFQPERLDLMVMRGYAYLNLERYSDAIRIFEAAAATGNQAAITGLSDARNAQASSH